MSRLKVLGTKRGCSLLALAAASVCFAPHSAVALPATTTCTSLTKLLLQNSDIVSATAAIQPVSGSTTAAYCLVNITVSDLSGRSAGYQTGQSQAIKVGIGLPLSNFDRGSGGVQGAWNGRIENLGGGGYAGSVGSVTSATNGGYVGASTDTGHVGSSGAFALNANNTLNWGLINDFTYNGIHAEAVWAQKLAQMYYGMSPVKTYWNGCSTGGRQGIELAMMATDPTLPHFDGILAGSPAVNFDRLSAAQQWGEVVMNNDLGAPITTAKLAAVQKAVTRWMASPMGSSKIPALAPTLPQRTRALHNRALPTA